MRKKHADGENASRRIIVAGKENNELEGAYAMQRERVSPHMFRISWARSATDENRQSVSAAHKERSGS